MIRRDSRRGVRGNALRARRAPLQALAARPRPSGPRPLLARARRSLSRGRSTRRPVLGCFWWRRSAWMGRGNWRKSPWNRSR